MPMPDIPATMKAVLLKGHGGYEQLEYRDDVPVPRPESDEVLVRIGAAGVNNTDINTRTAWYSRTPVDGSTTADGADDTRSGDENLGWTGAKFSFPRIQGADGCGRIVAAGAEVGLGRVGERVLIEPVIRRVRSGVEQIVYLGSECDGTFAEYVCVPAVNAHRISTGLSDAELAAVPCAYGAAEHMLARSQVTSGDTVLITGASGGVGSAAVQLAVRRGARVIAVAGTAKAAAVSALGAEFVIPRGADLVESLGPGSVDVAIDVAGGAQFGQLLDVLRRRGRYAVAGAISGPMVELDLRTLYLKDLRLEGCTVYDPVVFRELVGYIERGEIRPVIAAVYPLGSMVAAQEAFGAKAQVGKIVLQP
jgi:NADPH:quinone reductase-like Zn-dependent oxidoreductase